MESTGKIRDERITLAHTVLTVVLVSKKLKRLRWLKDFGLELVNRIFTFDREEPLALLLLDYLQLKDQ